MQSPFSQHSKPHAAICCSLLAVSFNCAVIIWFMLKTNVNQPYGDDFKILDFLVALHKTDSLPESVRLFFTPHNHHVIVFTKAAAFCVDFTFGNLNFTIFRFFSILPLFFLPLLIAFFIAVNTSQFFYYASLFSGITAFSLPLKLMHYPMAAAQGLWVLPFAIIFLGMTHTDKISHKPMTNILRWTSLVFALLTNTNAFLVFPATAFMALLRRKYTIGATYVLLTLASIFFLLMTVKTSSSTASIAHFLSFTCGILGSSCVFLWKNPPMAALLGCVLSLFAGFLLFFKPQCRKDFMVAFLIFIILSAAMIGFGRSSMYPLRMVFDGRYTIYGTLFLSMIAAAALSCLVAKKYFRTVLYGMSLTALALSLIVWQNTYLPRADKIGRSQAAFFNKLKNARSDADIYPRRKGYYRIYRDAVANGVYKQP